MHFKRHPKTFRQDASANLMSFNLKFFLKIKDDPNVKFFLRMLLKMLS